MPLRDRAAYMRRYRSTSFPSGHVREGEARGGKEERRIVAVDGEGHSTKDGRHLYTYLAACDETGQLVAEAERKTGLTFGDVTAFLFRIPANSLIVGFSLGYDRTKWIESLSNGAIYRLLHPPEKRRGEHAPKAIRLAKHDVTANLVSSRFTVSRISERESRTVWDLFKFFQCSFVKALRAWKIGTEREVSAIEKMKVKRGSFKGIGAKEKAYCQHECVLLAKLASALIDAHEEEGIKLTSFYGPGSTAQVILKNMQADEHNVPMTPRLLLPVLSAYFGGRFECSHVGPIKRRKGKLKSWDIASAYPYAFAQLPCMRCGTWHHLKGKKATPPKDGKLRATLYRVRIKPSKGVEAWGPLPFRMPDGTILFPRSCGKLWVWSAELYQAMRLHPGIEIVEAIEYRSRCRHPPPFQQTIVDLYKRRCSWGAGARGIVLKLALNSLYGKSAQRVGSDRYRCFVRAGLVTSFARSMLLAAVRRARDPWDVLELATDSVLTRVDLNLPRPLTLGTRDAAKAAGKAELGAWEAKTWDAAGAFLVRPGLRFPIARDGDASMTAARGVGTATLHRNRARLLRAWRRRPLANATIQQPSMFMGAKSCVRLVGRQYVRDEKYGRWLDPSPRAISYAAAPKRDAVVPRKGEMRLTLWDLPMNIESTPYGVADESALRVLLDGLRDIEGDQPQAGDSACL